MTVGSNFKVVVRAGVVVVVVDDVVGIAGVVVIVALSSVLLVVSVASVTGDVLFVVAGGVTSACGVADADWMYFFNSKTGTVTTKNL